MKKLIIGTSNPGKIREIANIIQPLGFEIDVCSLDIEETGIDISENSRIKAIGYSKNNPDIYVIVEDSGIVIPSLNNLPGAYSARFYSVELDGLNFVSVPRETFSMDKTETDDKNCDRVLELIKENGLENPTAFFEVCFCISLNGEVLFETSGKSFGYINSQKLGHNGFGYDPIFVGNDTFGKTYAELDSFRKNLRSHRKKALYDLSLWITQNIKS